MGDAKWKDIWTASGTADPSREDAYQLAAYMAAGQAAAGFLVAPLPTGGGDALLAVGRYTQAGTGKPIAIIGIHVPTLVNMQPSGAGLRRDFCAAIAGLVEAGGKVAAA